MLFTIVGRILLISFFMCWPGSSEATVPGTETQTQHQPRQCQVDQIKGKLAPPKDLEGNWYTLGYLAPELNFTASLFHLKRASDNVLNETEISVHSENGKPKCAHLAYTWTLVNASADDHYYVVKSQGEGESFEVPSRTLLFNAKFWLTYDCSEKAADGTCVPGKVNIWIMGRSGCVDPTEYQLLMNLVDSVCVESKTIVHTSTHDTCFRELHVEH